MNRVLSILLLIVPLFGFSQTDTIAHLYTFGGNNNDNAEEIAATVDGGYIVIGSTSSNSWGNTDTYLLKVDSMCNYEWSKAIGGANNDWGYSIKQTFDNGFIIASTSNSYGNGGYNAVLNKRDSLGNNVWQKVYGGQDWDFVYSVTQTYDSGYVFCGETYNNTNGFSDVYIVKTNPRGDTLWTRTYGGSLIDKGNCIIETSDSNIVVAGVTNTVSDSTEIYVIKLSPNGTLLWDSIYGDTLYETVNEIIEISSGDYVLAGATTSSSIGSDQDHLIKALSKDGLFLWDFIIVNLPSPTPADEEAFTVKQLSDNKLLIGGYTKTGGNNKNVAFFKLKPNGTWGGASVVFGNVADDNVKHMTIGLNGNILGAGVTSSFGAGMEDVLLVRLDTIYGGQDTMTYSFMDNIPLNLIENKDQSLLSVYPNPVDDVLNIQLNLENKACQLAIFDITGKKIYSKKSDNMQIDISHLEPGVYMLQAISQNSIVHQTKFVKY